MSPPHMEIPGCVHMVWGVRFYRDSAKEVKQIKLPYYGYVVNKGVPY